MTPTSYYHGTSLGFQLSKARKSRYGFWALFFTDQVELAKNYAKFHSLSSLKNKGCLIEIEPPSISKVFDLKYESTYTADFRRLILAEKKLRTKVLLLKNTLDSPSLKRFAPMSSNILVVYDHSIIQNRIINNMPINC